jgi:hypothetical protein
VAELHELFERHFLYEVWMLVETRQRLGWAILDDIVVRNALIESFCIHARALNDFFNDKKGAKASWFTLGTYAPSERAADYGAAISKLSTQIAHLTQRRTSDLSEKVNQIDREILFVNLIDEARNFRRDLKLEFEALWPSILELVVTPLQPPKGATATST